MVEGIGFQLFGSQLVRPRDTLGGMASWSAALVFGVEGRLFTCGLSPVVPAFGADVLAHLAVDKDDAGIVTSGLAVSWQLRKM